MRSLVALCLSLWLAPLFGPRSVEAEWKPAESPLMTRWAKEVRPDNVLPEYPRPNFQRDAWKNLNGLWDYAVTDSKAAIPAKWDGQILVPFAIESALSGVKKRLGPDEVLWYHRTFTLPQDEVWKGKRIQLHFGAVDWQCEVFLNGIRVPVGKEDAHRGGYDPFSFFLDVPGVTLNRTGDNHLVIRVVDPTDAGTQPRGKQLRKPEGIWYTPVSGIWQTVWLEPVPESYIRGATFTPDLDAMTITVRTDIENPKPGMKVGIFVKSQPKDAGGSYARSWHTELDKPFVIDCSKFPGLLGGTEDARRKGLEPHLWCPGNPHLIDIQFGLVSDPKANIMGFGQEWLARLKMPAIPGEPEKYDPVPLVDSVVSYTALRKTAIQKDEKGINRLFLNNKPLFQFGPLDQGWWPDGLYTAPTDEALKFDIQATKDLGFNMIRKHVKVEPARWYYWCDKLGMLVWQDMPSGDRNINPNEPDHVRTPESEAHYRREWQAIVKALHHHPSIVAWVPFNEGWGQFKTNEILDWTKSLDPTRVVDGPSGWADRGGGEMHDMHHYPGPRMFPVESGRASVLGEFGGLGLPIEGHTWLDRGNWGYRSFTSKEDLTAEYDQFIAQLPMLIADGLAAAVYTQTTDVEIEINGLLTYDREVFKMDPKHVAGTNAAVYLPPPKSVTLVPTSDDIPQEWRFTTEKPADDWEKPEFDATAWKVGLGGLGAGDPPGSKVRSTWKTSDVWARREFDLKSVDIERLWLRIHHDEDAEIYLNGVKIGQTHGYTTRYVEIPARAGAKQALRAGKNVLAVHCHQTGGGQYIDVGLIEARTAE